jgi:hypothetical protein
MKYAVLLGLSAAGLLRADCVDGMRRLTAEEVAFMQAATGAVAAALPQAWESWKISGDPPSFGNGGSVCLGTPVGAINVESVLVYRYINPPKRRAYPEEAEIKKLSDEIETLKVMPPDVRKQYNDVQAQQSEKRRAGRAAEKDGKKEEASALLKEADQISKGADKVRADFLASIGPQVQEREAKIRQLRAVVPEATTEVSVAVTVNERKQVPPAGKGLNQDVYVWGSPAPAKNGTNVQNVVLTVKGWPDYREMVTPKIDMAKLSALVK